MKHNQQITESKMVAYSMKYTEDTPLTRRIDNEQLNAFITEKLTEFESGYVVCWLHHKVLIGEIKEKQVYFVQGESPDYQRDMVRIRIFNQNKEWHIWNSAVGFQARLREEKVIKEHSNRDDTPFIDTELVLWGTQTKDLGNGFQRVREDRGTMLTLSSYLGKIEIGKRFVVQTRNYVGYNEIGQAGYVDSRFCNIFLKSLKLCRKVF